MNFVDFFQNNSLKSVREDDEDFIEFIDSIFNKYINALNNLEYCKDEWERLIHNGFCNEAMQKQVMNFIANLDIGRIKNICDEILNSLKAYYNGFSGKAYKIIEELLDNNYEILSFMKFDEIKRLLYAHSNIDTSIFYKIRRVEKNDKLVDREELFHIKFNEREKIRNERYSISGYPCIYMGKSIKLCWNECNKPLYFYLTSIDINSLGNDEFLLFREEPSQLASLLSKKNILEDQTSVMGFLEFLKKYLYTFPMLAACSIIVSKPNENFKPEYIVPNLLTQYIRKRSSKFRGIVYFSCKNANDIYEYNDNINIAIPTISDSDNKRAYSEELGKKMKFSEISRHEAKDEDGIKKVIEEFKAQDFRKLF